MFPQIVVVPWNQMMFWRGGWGKSPMAKIIVWRHCRSAKIEKWSLSFWLGITVSYSSNRRFWKEFFRYKKFSYQHIHICIVVNMCNHILYIEQCRKAFIFSPVVSKVTGTFCQREWGSEKIPADRWSPPKGSAAASGLCGVWKTMNQELGFRTVFIHLVCLLTTIKVFPTFININDLIKTRPNGVFFCKGKVQKKKEKKTNKC